MEKEEFDGAANVKKEAVPILLGYSFDKKMF